MRVKKPPIRIIQKRRILPPRMAQKWKLVPTPRHKQCPNTMCEVYIGNGCRKCPKCKTEQPKSLKKRKRTTQAVENLVPLLPPKHPNPTPVTKKKKTRTPRKNKVETPDGDPIHYYYAGAKVKVFWPRMGRWTWGVIASKFTPKKAPDANASIIYSVRLRGIVDQFGDDTVWYLNGIPTTHLKKRKAVGTGIKGRSSERKDVVYMNINDLDKWSNGDMSLNTQNYPWPQLNPAAALQFITESNLNDLPYSADWPIWENGNAHFPSCVCTNCLATWISKLSVVSSSNKKPQMHDDLKDLRVGSLLKWQRLDDYGRLLEVTEMRACVNPFFSQVAMRTVDENSKWTGKMHWRPADSKYPDGGFGGYLLHDICFIDGTARSYYNEAALTIYKEMVKLVRKRGIDWEATTEFKLTTNNFVYDISLTATYGQSVVTWKGEQMNSETRVKRTMSFKPFTKPKVKQLKDYKASIIKSIGNHDFTWMDATEALNDPLLNGCKHPPNRRFLGMVRFNQPFVNIQKRSSEYSKFNVPHDIKRVYHGTYARNLFPILHPMGGFAMARESNGKAYGQGVYFANSPNWVVDQGYAPGTSFDGSNLKCIIGAQIIASKDLVSGTDTMHRNASVREATSSIGSPSNSSNGINFDGKQFEVTGGNTQRSIHVVWYDRCKTDINITHVLWYK